MELTEKFLSSKVRVTIALLYFGFTRIPVLLYVRLSVVDISTEKVVVKVPFGRRTKNHLGSMCVGALAVGANCAAGKGVLRRYPDELYSDSNGTAF